MGCTNLLSPYFPLSLVASLRTTISQRTIRLELALLVGDLAGLLVNIRIGESNLRSGGVSGQIVSLSNKRVYVSREWLLRPAKYGIQWNRLSWACLPFLGR